MQILKTAWDFFQNELLGMHWLNQQMPALVVNEKVVSQGKVLKAADVEKLLHKLGF